MSKKLTYTVQHVQAGGKNSNSATAAVADKGTQASAAFFSWPIFSFVRSFNQERFPLLLPAKKSDAREESHDKKILWFIDQLTDLNGPAMTLKKLGWLAHERGIKLSLVSSLFEHERMPDLPPNVINLPMLFTWQLPWYKTLTLRIPSLIKALRIVKEYRPDEIYISTPGPIGLLGLIAAKLLHVKKIGIYHTDFYIQTLSLSNNRLVPIVWEKIVQKFYSAMDEIQVPTKEYIGILKKRGYQSEKMTIFRRGIDSKLFAPRDTGKSFLMEKYNIRDGITMLYIGRISHDKNLNFLMDFYRELIKRNDNVNLVMVGAGPYFDDLQAAMKDCPRVIFTGQMPQSMLSEIYSGADIFVFPSIMDTFGMAVLEAQACGLPAIVTDAGGPKEIIIDGSTGFVAEANNMDQWLKTFDRAQHMIEKDYNSYLVMKEKSRKHVLDNFNWEITLNTLNGRASGFEPDKINIA